MRWMPLLLLVACLKPTVAQAPSPIPVEVVAIMDQGERQIAPAALADRLADELSKRSLVPEKIDGIAVTGGKAFLIVESSARFSSQINGRYRWTVSVLAIVSPAEGEASTQDFTVPVHLVHYHDKEEEALAEAAPLIARQVGRLIDDWIGSL